MKNSLLTLVLAAVVSIPHSHCQEYTVAELEEIVATEPDGMMKVDALGRLTRIYGYTSPKSVPLLVERMRISQAQDLDYRLHEAMYDYAVKYILESNHEKADSLLKECYQYYSSNAQPYDAFYMQKVLGINHRYQGNNFNALQQWTEALDNLNALLPDFEPYDKISIDNMMDLKSEILNDLGSLSRTVGNNEKAFKYYQDALSLNRKWQLENDASVLLGNLGLILVDEGKHDEAIDKLIESLTDAENSGQAHQIKSAHLRLIDTYIDIGNLPQANFHINSVRKEIENSENQQQKSRLYYYLGRLAEAKNELSPALRHFNKSFAIAKSNNDEKRIKDNSFKLFKLYLALGQSKKALEHYDVYIKYKSLFDEKKNDKKVAYEKARWEYDNQVMELELANTKEKFNNEQRLIKLNHSRNLSFAGLLGATIICALLIRAYRIKRKYSNNLASKNELIEKSLAEKELLLKEIHHRVKNNLQVVSSLLSLQSDDLDDEKTKSALREGQNRVASMALIHQNLYQEENLVEVETKPYFERLVAQLKQSMSSGTTDVNIYATIDPMRLDVDTMIPIGLIATELIINSYKYAFKGRAQGSILVKFQNINNRIELQVKDDGIGSDKNETQLEESFGTKLIRAFCQKLNADLSVQKSNGVSTTISFKTNQK